MINKTQTHAVCLLLAGIMAAFAQAAEWKDLFNGSDLDRWKQLGGDAKYKVEGDSTGRRFSGGLFDEKIRKWLYPLTLNEKGRDAFKMGHWNKFRIEAIGNSVQVWVNGIQTSALVDEMDDEGFFGLQVHSIKKPCWIGWQSAVARSWQRSQLQEPQSA